MKSFELLFTFLQLPLDYIMIVAAGVTAYVLRYTKWVTSVRPIRFDLPWETYWPMLLFVSFAWLVIFALSGLYSFNPNRKFAKEIRRIVMACSTGFAGITIYVFFTLQKFDSRFLVLVGGVLALLYVFLGRLALRGLKGLLHRWGLGLRRTIIIGQEEIAQTIAATFKTEPRLGYQIVGSYTHFDTKTLQPLSSKIDEIIR